MDPKLCLALNPSATTVFTCCFHGRQHPPEIWGYSFRKSLQLVSDQADMVSASIPPGTFQLESGRQDLH